MSDPLDRALRALAGETARAAPVRTSTAWLRLAAGRREERRRAGRLVWVRAVAALLPALALTVGLLGRPPGPLAPILVLAVAAAFALGLLAGARKREAAWPEDLSPLARPRP